MTQRITYGTAGQTLRHVPPARVTSATYAIEDLSVGDTDASRFLVASAAATVAAWSVTTTAAAGRGTSNAKRITATTTTGATVGAPSAIVAADGTAEIFEVAAVSASTYVEAEAHLAGSFPSGSTVYGILVSATVPSSIYDDEDLLEQRRPMRVVWTYTVGGVPLVVQELVEFVRHDRAALLDYGGAILRVRRLYPDLPDRLPGGATLDALMPELANEIADDLRQRPIEPETFLAGPAGIQLLSLRLVAHAGELGYAPGATSATDGVWARAAMARYRERFESLVLGEPGGATAEVDRVSDTVPNTPSHVSRGPTLRM